MKKKILSTALIVSMAFGLMACANGASGNTTNQSEITKSSASGSNVFTIGAFGPLTGAAAAYGNSIKQGAEIAVEEINASGGVMVGDSTYTFALNFIDDQASEGIAVTAYDALLDNKVNAIMGGVTSGATLAALDKAEKDGLLMITPSGSAKAITEPSNVFRLCFTDPIQGVTIADYVVEKDYNSVAVLYNNADEYSTGIYEAFKEELAAKGKADVLVAEESFVTEDVDYSTQLTEIKAKGAELIFVPAYYQAIAYITQQAKAAGMDVDFIGSDGWDGVIAQVTDPSVVEDAIFLSPFLATDAGAKSFVERYEVAYKAIPDQFAADGYDTVYVMKAAIEKAGSIESEDMIVAMTEIEVNGLTGKVRFDASGEPVKEAKFVQIKNGEYTAFTE